MGEDTGLEYGRSFASEIKGGPSFLRTESITRVARKNLASISPILGVYYYVTKLDSKRHVSWKNYIF